jgi:dihydropteroate synthase
MGYKIRKLQPLNKKQAAEEFKIIGATANGQEIMVRKIFPLALKVKAVDIRAANILKQEMLARNGDVVTSRDVIVKSEGLTDVIILGSPGSISNLAEKIRQQPFGLKKLSETIGEYLKKISIDDDSKKKLIDIAGRNFDTEKEGALIMGILNVTPDSFYDGGSCTDESMMRNRVSEIVEEGAHIIDIGGLSTRPGSAPVSPEEEISRILPAIEFTKNNFDIIISADTYRSVVAKRAIEAGAHIINDISGLGFDENMAGTIAEAGVWVVIMHIKGTPETMQQNPEYGDVVDEIYDFLFDRAEMAAGRGVGTGKIIIDPGVGFGKNVYHNLKIISRLSEFKNMGFPVMLGASRKSFIGSLLNNKPPSDRLEGSIAAAVCGFVNGADIIRVHDVRQTKEAIRIAASIKNV